MRKTRGIIPPIQGTLVLLKDVLSFKLKFPVQQSQFVSMFRNFLNEPDIPLRDKILLGPIDKYVYYSKLKLKWT